MHFNPPPNWPAVPEGWQPPPGWRPDPSWGPPPYGWALWVEDDSGDTPQRRGGSKVAGAIKHPVWVTVGTVVGILALGISAVAYVQSSSPSDGRLSVAAVTLGEPTDLSAIYIEPTGEVSNTPMDGVAAEPIDVTLKNDGGSVASIKTVTATIIDSEYILSCLRQGAGGIAVAAEYALRIPPNQLDGEGAQVSNAVDFKIDAGKTGRFVVTVGPEQQPESSAVVVAVRLSFGLDDGGVLETDPVVIGTTHAIIDELVSEVASADPGDEQVGRLCERELKKIDDVVGVGSVRAEAVDELREAYSKAAQLMPIDQSGPAAPPPGSQRPLTGDLGLAQPMSAPPCNGQGIAVLGSVTTPGMYPAGVQRLLDANPGASYLRTDQTCPSLRAATEEGNPIYAVFTTAGSTEAEVCASVQAAGGDAYGKWLDYTTDPGWIIPC